MLRESQPSTGQCSLSTLLPTRSHRSLMVHLVDAVHGGAAQSAALHSAASHPGVTTTIVSASLSALASQSRTTAAQTAASPPSNPLLDALGVDIPEHTWKASNRNKSQDNQFAHLEEGETIPHPGARDKTSRKTPADTAFAINFALTRGPRAVAKFSGSQQSILQAISKSLSPGNTWILTHAERPAHVRATAPNVNVLLLCTFADSTGTDFNLSKDLLYCFQLTGILESSMMHRKIPRPEPIAFAAACHKLEKFAWPSLLDLAKSITDSHHSTPPLDCAELVTVTVAQVRDRTCWPFSQHKLFQRLYNSDPIPGILPDGSVCAPVCSLRFGVRQGLKLRPCED